MYKASGIVTVSHVEVDVAGGELSIGEAEREAVRRYLRENPGASAQRMARDLPMNGQHSQAFLHRVFSSMADELDRGHRYEQSRGYVLRVWWKRSWKGGCWWLKTHPPPNLAEDHPNWGPSSGRGSLGDPYGTYPHPRKDTKVDGKPVRRSWR